MLDLIYYSSLATTATGIAIMLWIAWCLRGDLPWRSIKEGTME